MHFSRTRIQNPRPVQLFGKLILWVEADSYLGVFLDTRLTCSSHFELVRRGSCPEAESAGVSPVQEGWTVYMEPRSVLYAAHPSHDGLPVLVLEIHRPFPFQEASSDSVQVFSRCNWCTLVHK